MKHPEFGLSGFPIRNPILAVIGSCIGVLKRAYDTIKERLSPHRSTYFRPSFALGAFPCSHVVCRKTLVKGSCSCISSIECNTR
ncbi:hypothetical protein Agabi119p4_6110 [Agaricus bisporus var. burnettii]|uniref:Uncharacterized protein n=1 Tax=Agaricus bisporus var. burnettii TaxID=192524 RepID=A0A8H7F170_AGABI|nr:hypothetical protein Agabi119p4_6110 [Agaricus bisporus var. burnettii]